VTDSKTLLEAAAILSRLGRRWWVSGGWALDLFLGRVTREHHDVDTLVLRSDQRDLRACLRELRPEKIMPHPEGLMNQGTLAPWKEGEWLELPVHQIDVHRDSDGLKFQVMLAESSGADWVYRRNRTITTPLRAMGIEPLWSLPYLAPEIVLLFKAKHLRPHDQLDFRNVAGSLSPDARRWLRHALEVCHPGHEWLRQL
jgi:aminoglycoside-2''-adenylyltransferase